MHGKALWFAMAVAVSGCGDSMMGGEGALRDQVDGTRAEIEVHAAAVAASSSMSEIRAEMTRHDDTMADMMDEMAATMDDMPHCAGEGMGHMAEMHYGMVAEMDGHRATMAGAADMAAARDETERHTAAMAGMMGGMGDAMGHLGCGM